MNAIVLERPIARKVKTFLEREFPEGQGAKFVRITPAIARELLTRNPDNRKVSDSKVKQYASDMANGRWEENGESIIIADDGNLNTGQHRLLACIEADTPFRTLLCYGVSRSTRTTVDTGKSQGAGDKLSMLGVPNANNIAAMAKMALAYEKSGGRSVHTTHYYVTNSEALEYQATHKDDLQDAFRIAHRYPKTAQGLASPTLFGFAAYLLREKGDVAKQYLMQVMAGENIAQNDPAYRVRERLAGMGKGNRQSRIEAILRGWLFHRDGKQMTLVKITGELPSF